MTKMTIKKTMMTEMSAVVVTILLVSQHALGLVAHEGQEFVTLSCQVSDPVPEDSTVVWSRQDLTGSIIHARRQSGDVLEDQNQNYVNRTSMRPDALKTGDLSLTLRTPTIADSDTYTCIIREKGVEKSRQEVHLNVTGECPPPLPPPPPSPWPVVVAVVVTFLVVVASGCLIWYKWRKVREVQQVEVEEGAESVLLPVNTNIWWLKIKMLRCTAPHLPEDVRVEWTDEDNRKVHVYQNGSVEQDQVYRGRTEMKKDLMETGDFSLTLRDLRVPDSGRYTCTISRGEGILMKKQVNLLVPGQQVEVESGAESVLLPFNTTAHLPEDVRVEWTDRDNRKVHVYQNGSVEQDQVYRGRTEMNEDLMETGDFSLTLRHPTERDTGDYTCRVYNRNNDILKKKQVELLISVQQVEVVEGAESVQLPFKTTADLPEEVLVIWWNNEKRKVHVYHNGSDQPEEQDQVYRGRTGISEDLMKTGDLSLILRRPTERDTGDYTCRVFNKDGNFLREKSLKLKVKEKTHRDETVDMRNRSSSTDPTPLMADQSV